jgi:hypothetical protein
VLRTRSPVVSKKASFFLLPLDLHVLGLPLAFILSQDQTLHCSKFNLILASKIDVINLAAASYQRTYIYSPHSAFRCVFVFSKRTAKIETFLFLKNLFKFFFQLLYFCYPVSKRTCAYCFKAGAKIRTYFIHASYS